MTNQISQWPQGATCADVNVVCGCRGCPAVLESPEAPPLSESSGFAPKAVQLTQQQDQNLQESLHVALYYVQSGPVLQDIF